MTTKTFFKRKSIIAAIILLTLTLTILGTGHVANAAIVRESYATITDANRFTQNCDTVRLPESRGAIKSKGFQYILITIKSIIWEKDDGFQSILIYTAADPNAAMIDEFKFEHSPGYTSAYMHTVVNKITIALAHLSYDEIILRYGGSGSGADTFYIKNLEVDFVYTNNIMIKNTTVS